MPFVIAEPCISTCDTACVDACPVDAIHGLRDAPFESERVPDALRGPRRGGDSHGAPPDKPRLRLFIDPESCICCSACEPVCPVSAIFEDVDLPPEWQHYAEINAAFFRPGGNGTHK